MTLYGIFMLVALLAMIAPAFFSHALNAVHPFGPFADDAPGPRPARQPPDELRARRSL